MEKYNAGLYCRLSREDENSTSQSESIKNQMEYLTQYVLEKGWNNIDLYIDDGYSGTSFDRPAFKRMIGDIEAGRINLVVTKDLSRLGRDYIETGRYMEKYFPEKNIRYVAINDGIDTFADDAGNDMSPFKSVINDMYARDISKKVRSVFRVKVASGKFIGAFAPYGYEKDPRDKNRLIVDRAAASIVRRIYGMYLDGKGPAFIARTLNMESLPNPAAYKASVSGYKNRGTGNALWSHNTVKTILSSPTYAGNLAQSKYRKAGYKSKKLRAVHRADWVIVENTHEPIIAAKDFELVQKRLYGKGTARVCRKPAKPLSGLVFCGNCGESMTFSKTSKGYEYLICSKYKRFGSGYCSRHSIRTDDLQAFVFDDIKAMIDLAVKYEKGPVILYMKFFASISSSSELYSKMLELLIDKIEIFEDNSLKITYTFKDPIENRA